MDFTFSEKIKIILKRKKWSVERLADALGTSKQNLNQKLQRDNLKYSDMKKIADALGYDLIIELKEKPVNP